MTETTAVTSLTLPAPAKLNLMLHITGRRDNGYHELQTLFQFLDYGDQLTFSARSDDQITLTPAIDGVASEDNLIVKAARCIQQAQRTLGQPLGGVDIELTKILPMGGGLGGGSSDAATTLLALNSLWQVGLNLDELADIGLALGADVPVFVHGYAAFAEGVGEQLTPVPELAERWFVVVHPNVHANTAEIFQHKDLTRNTPAISIRTALEQGGRNDCQAVVQKLYPDVDNALKTLAKFAPAQMTGTGACVFASFDTESEAFSAFEQINTEYRAIVARGVNQSPAHTLLFSAS